VLLLALLPTVLFAAACSSDGDSTAAETIDIAMVDNAFQPDRISVPRGERVALRFTNEGSVRHEAMIGDEAAQMDHHADMEDGTAGEDGHGGGHGGSADTVTVEPGEQATLTVTVDDDDVLIGCHEVGHWEDGMRAAVVAR
jgi:uncharacterized cupredoxin-like copper-binding protein